MLLSWEIGGVDIIAGFDNLDRYHKSESVERIDRSDELGCHQVFAATERCS